MNYEQAYNDLIARINKVKEKPSLCMKDKHHYNGYVETGIRDALDYIVNPESEDERIRKQIEQEQPEVDLEKEITPSLVENMLCEFGVQSIEDVDSECLADIARHFYELGCSTQYQKDREEFAKLKAKEWLDGFDAGYEEGIK